MESVKIWGDNPSDRQIDEIVSHLKQGEVVIVPTDSVYSLVCDAVNARAVERLCAVKGLNPERNLMSVICSDISMASEYASYDNRGFELLKRHTPCPVTFIFKSARKLPKAFKNRKEIGIRIPNCITTRQIVAGLGNPLFATSIETTDEDYGRSPGLIAERYRYAADFMVEGDEGDMVHTTIVDARNDELEVLREGKYKFD